MDSSFDLITIATIVVLMVPSQIQPTTPVITALKDVLLVFRLSIAIIAKFPISTELISSVILLAWMELSRMKTH